MIPKKIHYCWFGGNKLPLDVEKCIRSWKKYCPDYEIIEWNESNFDIGCHPFVQSAYDKKAWAFVSDYVRLKVVFDYGGIYLDTDVELIKNLDFLLENECYVGIQQSEFLCATGLGFGATKLNPVIWSMMNKYDGLLFREDIKNQIACPYLNHSVLKEMGYQYVESIWKKGGLTVYPCKYFDPLAPGKTRNLLCSDTVSIHHYSASWTSTSNKLKRKLMRLVGDENIYNLKYMKEFIRKKYEDRIYKD